MGGNRETSGRRRSHAQEPGLVFVSYSSSDLKYLDMLKPHLSLLEKLGSIRTFTHDALRPGSLWMDETRSAILAAAAAVLLVTPDYLDSEIITGNELPQLLVQAKNRGTEILPLLVEPSLFERTELFRFTPFNRTPKTFYEMKGAERKRFLLSVAKEVDDIVRRNRLE